MLRIKLTGIILATALVISTSYAFAVEPTTFPGPKGRKALVPDDGAGKKTSKKPPAARPTKKQPKKDISTKGGFVDPEFGD